jgi:presqualene diphosphate synthase
VSTVATIDPGASAAKARASGSSFYLAMRILPRPQREALFAIYDYCRAVDDVADERGPRDARLAELRRWRSDIEALYAGSPPDRLRSLGGPVRRYDLQKPDFLAVIDGMEMDVVANIRAPDCRTLDLYCDRVASAVGRLCVRVFGMAATEGGALAHHLGRALQLTNILRDLDEDAAMGRLYLPREVLDAAGIRTSEPIVALMNPALDRACARLVETVRAEFQAADAVMRRCPRRRVRAPRIMAEAYKLLFDKLIERGWSSPRAGVRLSRPHLVWIVLRHAVM